MGDRDSQGLGDDAGGPTPSKRPGSFGSQPPPLWMFNPVYAAMLEAKELYLAHSAKESGVDTPYRANGRKAGWIPGRGAYAPGDKRDTNHVYADDRAIRREKAKRNRSLIVEPSLHWLEQQDKSHATSAQRRLVGDADQLLRENEQRNRDATISEETEDLTVTEIEQAVERVVQRENQKLRDAFLNAIAASTEFDPVAEAEKLTGEAA